MFSQKIPILFLLLRFTYIKLFGQFTDEQGANCMFSEDERIRFTRVPIFSVNIPVFPVLGRSDLS